MPNTPPYNSQNRWDQSAYEHYYAGMDKTIWPKLATVVPHFLSDPGARIVDMGMGSGTSTYYQALLNPDTRVIGVDINPVSVQHASEKYTLPNVSYQQGDIENVLFDLNSLDGILDSSSLHHVYSFTGYSKWHVRNAIENQVAQLKEGGILVIRDFLEIEDGMVLLELPNEPNRGDGVKKCSDIELLKRFSTTARGLKQWDDCGFFMEEVPAKHTGTRLFRLSAKYATEFVLRKDYRKDWETEILEEYTYFSQKEFETIFRENGLRVLFSAPTYNPWIVRNRFRGKFKMYSEEGKEMDYPPTNYVIVGQKVSLQAGIQLSEKRVLPMKGPSFLQFSSYADCVTGKVFDCVERAGTMRDIIPYTIKGKRIFVMIKHSYPRPIINTNPRWTHNIDAKHYSGYVTEQIGVLDASTAVVENTQKRLFAVLGISETEAKKEEKALTYYPSPGGINEQVSSYFLPLDSVHPNTAIDAAISHFHSSGTSRMIDIQELLRVAQTGWLPEARLELNLYFLLHHLGKSIDPWVGDNEIHIETGHVKNKTTIEKLMTRPQDTRFSPTQKRAGFLEHIRSHFVEEGRNADESMSAIANNDLEFVIPKTTSTNTVSVLPVLRDSEDDEIYVMLEERYLPVPQMQEGSSRIFTTHAFRLRKNITTFHEMEQFIASEFHASEETISRLGESYFPSMGITPEKVYPYIISSSFMISSEGYRSVSLKSLFQNISKLRDAHLMVAIMRTVHALGLWEEYRQK